MQIGVVVAALLVVVLVIGVVWFVSERNPDPVASPAPAASTPVVTPTWEWPVQTPDPASAVDLVPGDGTFVDPEAVDRTDPDAVAQAAATLVVSHDAALDDSRTDAQTRLGSLAAPGVLDGLVEPQGSGLGADWLAAAPYRGYTTPVVELVPRHDHVGPEDHPDVNAAGEPVRGYEFRATYQWAGRETIPAAEQPAPQTRTVMLSLAQRDGLWTVVDPPYVETPVG